MFIECLWFPGTIFGFVNKAGKFPAFVKLSSWYAKRNMQYLFNDNSGRKGPAKKAISVQDSITEGSREECYEDMALGNEGRGEHIPGRGVHMSGSALTRRLACAFICLRIIRIWQNFNPVWSQTFAFLVLTMEKITHQGRRKWLRLEGTNSIEPPLFWPICSPTL